MRRKALLFSPLALIPAGTHDAAAGPARQPVAATMSPPAWTGFYLGLNLGGISERSELAGALPANPNFGSNYCFGGAQPQFGQQCATGSQTATGVLGGAQVGYNFMNGQWIYGAETDFDLSSARKQTNGVNAPNAFLGTWTAKNGIQDFGTARLRLGYDFHGVMPFVTGGLAYAKTADSFSGGSTAGAPYAFSGTSWRAGYAVGGGVEVLISRNVSVKAEGLYYDLGSQSPVLPGSQNGINFGLTDRMTGALGRVGINYLFH
jgi:outer membrane immunogenic protein